MLENKKLKIDNNRIIAEANYMIKTGCTIRVCAKHFGLSKSTIHLDMSKRLKEIDNKLWQIVQCVIYENKKERAKRSGMATKKIWLSKVGGKYEKAK